MRFPRQMVAVTLSMATAGFGACDRGPGAFMSDEGLLEFERASLRRQLDSDLGTLSEAFERGDVLVSIREGLVRELIAASLPFEQTVSDLFLIRAEDVEVDFRPGMALVEFAGRASPAVGRDVSVDIAILASFEILEVTPDTPDLRAKLSVLGFQVKGLPVGRVLPPVERLINDLGRSRLGLFNQLLGEIEIPIRLERDITLPAVDAEEVTIPAARLPLSSEVRGVYVGDDRLWVSLKVALTPEATEEEPAQAAAATSTAEPASTAGMSSS